MANFGHKVANSGKPELLAAKFFQVPCIGEVGVCEVGVCEVGVCEVGVCEVGVCEEFVTKQNSLRCAVLEIWVPHEKAVTGNYR